jgi:hypothetical protein
MKPLFGIFIPHFPVRNWHYLGTIIESCLQNLSEHFITTYALNKDVPDSHVSTVDLLLIIF